uniref:Uncharacterized protein n=1 Tax=Rhizophora mucronata TaxID=61149 RepID=A0A2P2PCR9_RHIMU
MSSSKQQFWKHLNLRHTRKLTAMKQ